MLITGETIINMYYVVVATSIMSSSITQQGSGNSVNVLFSNMERLFV